MRASLYDTYRKKYIPWAMVYLLYVSITCLVMAERVYAYKGNLIGEIVGWILLGLLCPLPVILVIALLCGSPKRVIRRVQKVYDVSEDELEADFQRAKEVIPNCYIGARFSFFITDSFYATYLQVLQNSDIVWVCQSDMGIGNNFTKSNGKSYYLWFYELDKRKLALMLQQVPINKIRNYYMQNFPHIVCDSTPEIHNLYKEDKEAFVRLQYSGSWRVRR